MKKLLSAAALLLLSCSRTPGPAAAPPPATHTIVIEGMRFHPDTLTVAAGDTVVWVNKDMFAHTAATKGTGFDSKSIEAGMSWTYKPAAAGTFTYICALHPTMIGTLRVR